MASSAKLILLPLLLLSPLASTLSRSIEPTATATTTILDVAVSTQQTKAILSFDPESITLTSQNEFTTFLNSTSSSSFSVELRSRDTVWKTHHKDYKSLLHSRLARDATRVKSLNARLELALTGISKSELKPVIQTEDLSSPVTSGTSQGSGEYFSRVGVGRPAKAFYMVLDTGSDVSWLQCKPCSDCYNQADPIFDPATSSSSYKPLSCESQQCSDLEMSSCHSGKCLYQVNYGDGSFTFGDFATETVTFGNTGVADKVALGCGHDNEGLFVGAAGLLGLGGGPLSLTSQLKASSFSYCLVNRDSPASSTLDFNSGPLGDAVLAPLMRSSKIRTFFYVGLTGMSVGGQALSIPSSIFQLDQSGNGGVIVDCGTAITRLRTQAYDPLRDAFVGMTGHLRPASGVALFDTCYDLSGLSRVRVPTVSFHLAGGKSWNLPASNYLIPVDSVGTYCFAFAPTTSSMSIIGNVQQQGTRVSFDLANNRVGFSTNKC